METVNSGKQEVSACTSNFARSHSLCSKATETKINCNSDWSRRKRERREEDDMAGMKGMTNQRPANGIAQRSL